MDNKKSKPPILLLSGLVIFILLAFLFLFNGMLLPFLACLFFVVLCFMGLDAKSNKDNIYQQAPVQKMCPYCRSTDFEYFIEQSQVGGKMKTRNSLNLNPLHPLTITNSTTKVVKNAKTVSKSRCLCHNCGKIFD